MNTLLRITWVIGCLVVLVALAPGPGYSQAPLNLDSVEIHALPVQGNVTMLVGAGGNIAVQTGRQGVLMVDTQYPALSGRILDAIHKLSEGPLRYIIDTSVDEDHTGGNENLRKAGVTITGANVTRDIADAAVGAAIIAHEAVMDRMSAPSGKQAPTPSGAWPTDTYLSEEKELFFNDDSIRVIHVPAAHSDGDSIVYFRRADVIATGDIFMTTTYPVIDLEKGGSVQGLINGLNLILSLAIPEHEEEGGTLIIPGHGRLCDEFDVVEYRDMVVIIRDRIRALIKKGMTLEQVKQAKPTADYDGRYGEGTTDRFVESVYKSLNHGK
jgi:cyclase